MRLYEVPEIEQQALHLLLAARGVPSQLVEQGIYIVGVAREQGVAGIYLDFQLDESATPLDGAPNFHIADLTGVNTEAQEVEFLLFVRDGLLACMEVYTVFDTLPHYDGVEFRSAAEARLYK